MSDDLQKQLEELQEANKRLLEDKNKALTDKVTAREERERQDKERLETDGNYEQLYKDSKQETVDINNKLNTLQQKIDSEARYASIRDEVSKHTDGHNIGLMSDIIARQMETVDGSPSVKANPAQTLTELVQEHVSNEKYASLLHKPPTPTTPEGAVSRQQFDAMSPEDKMKNAHLVRATEHVLPTTNVKDSTNTPSITRSEFMALPEADKGTTAATHQIVEG